METEDQHKSRLAEQEQNDKLKVEAADKERKEEKALSVRPRRGLQFGNSSSVREGAKRDTSEARRRKGTKGG